MTKDVWLRHRFCVIIFHVTLSVHVMLLYISCNVFTNVICYMIVSFYDWFSKCSLFQVEVQCSFEYSFTLKVWVQTRFVLNTFLWWSQVQYIGLFQNTNRLEHSGILISLKIISPVFPGANGEMFSALEEVNLLPQHPSSARERRRLKQRALECAVRTRTDRCDVTHFLCFHSDSMLWLLREYTWRYLPF